ncbi:MAG: peptidylprolyl isomerase, partial [Bacteroidales bacterium]
EIKDELRRLVKDQMLVDQVQSEIMRNVEITPQEVRNFFRNIPKDSIPNVPTEYEVVQLVKKPPISIEDKMEVRERLNEMRERILAGERFSTLAVLYSEDPGSARKGGELGFYGRGELYPEFEAVAFKLRDGEVSEIVETQAGFHIIQLITRRGEYVNVRHILLMTKVSPYALEKAKTELDSIAQLIRDEKISFEEAVEQFSQDEGKVNGGYLVNPYTGGIRFDTETLDPQVAFVIDKLEVNDISEPVPMKTEDGKDAYRLLKLKVKTNPHQANLKDDYNRIQQWALQDKQQQAVDKWTIKKSKNAFISISENYKDCPFSFDWKGQE